MTVLDKGRGPGGRASTRRSGADRFDHGAQYFTARDARFQRQVELWRDGGIAAEWLARFGVVSDGRIVPKPGGPARFVGVPGMDRIARELGSGLEIRFGTRVVALHRTDGRWTVTVDDGSSFESTSVVLALPAAQAGELLEGAPESPLSGKVAAVRMEPCWAVMATFEEALPVEYDGMFISGSPLGWAARNSSKPGRPERDAWVLHASGAWTEAHLDVGAEEISTLLLRAFADVMGGVRISPLTVAAHRWMYSRAVSPLDSGCLWDAAIRLGICGDWSAGSRIEGAYLSGVSAAETVWKAFEGSAD